MPSTKVGETIGLFTQGVLVFMVYFSFETLFSTIIIIERTRFSINIIRFKKNKEKNRIKDYSKFHECNDTLRLKKKKEKKTTHRI